MKKNGLSNWLNGIAYEVAFWKYNTIQFFAQSLPWELKMKLKSLIHQTPRES